MSQKLQEFIDQLNKQKTPRLCAKTNKYGGEVVRVNQVARTKLQQMVDVTKIPKRSLLSYAVALLHEEFEKWRQGKMDAKFGYEVVEIEENNANAD